ncbi:MAG: DUF3883 domain-containing protein [Desulfotomaculum sp.]|nr:DUF3883 domain-containing protein [Desulfotomaculum sp.]
MNDNHCLALIIAFYLSKYDKKALHNLGFKTFSHAFNTIGNRLGVKPSTLKNMRDEFDPLYNNTRVGWYQRELRPSRQQVLKIYDHLSEDALTLIVKDILEHYQDPGNNKSLNHMIRFYIDNIKNFLNENKSESKNKYRNRGRTGIKAETYFQEYFESNKSKLGFINNKLIDKRHEGCGYDFAVEDSEVVFEVKGLAENNGTINFTDKEWEMAKMFGNNYILVIVYNIASNPKIRIINDPYMKFNNNLQKAIYRTVTVNWTLNWKP